MTSAEDRQKQALELHLAGASYDQIAEAVGYAGRSGAHKAVQEALKRRRETVDEEPADTELARLDAMLTGLWPKARRGDVQAVDRVLKIEERRDELLVRQKLAGDQPAKPAADAPKRTPLDEVTARRNAKKPAPRRRTAKKAT